MAEHTKGPWRLERPEHIRWRGPSGAWVIMAGDKIICQRPWAEGNPEAIREMEANGWLILAAPDLLRACKAALAALEPGEWPDTQVFDDAVAITTLRAAIAKAREVR